ncbi:MAG: hypothetical protein ACREM8_11395 [Vulcanimicrobiaceae bacterium]
MTRCARTPAGTHLLEKRGPGAQPRPLAASSDLDHLAPDASGDGHFFFRRIIVAVAVRVCTRDAQLELLTAVDAPAAPRLIVKRLDFGVQAHLAVIIGRRRGVLCAQWIVDDLVTGQDRINLVLRCYAARVPADVVSVLNGRE